MSELIAEARVLVTPDTTTFRTLLATELAAIAKTTPPVPVNITPVVTGATGTAAASAGRAELVAATAALVAATERSTQALVGNTTALAANTTAEGTNAASIRGATEARAAASAATATHARSLSGLTSGAASAGLSLVGLRGATLAATGPFLAGAAGAIALGKSLGIATSFNTEIAVLGATTEATGEQLEVAADAARAFGRDITLPGVTAGDAAKTITEFAKAGLEMNDAIAATRGGLQLAQAAQLSYTDAVTLTANALNAFNLSGEQAVHVADVLANASNLAQGGIGDMALALRQAAGAAAVVGVSFEDTSALLTLLAQNGLTGSDAGTALRTAFIRLVNPSEEAKKILADLNVELRALDGSVRPEVFAEFARAQSDLTVAQQQANAAIVFGQDAFRAFGFLAREGVSNLSQVRKELDKQGTAAKIAAARMQGLAGAQENLSNQLSNLGLTIGEAVTPLVTGLVNELADLATVSALAVTEIKDLGVALEDLPGAETDRDLLEGLRTGLREGLRFIPGGGSAAGAILDIRDEVNEASDDAEESLGDAGADLRSALEDVTRVAVINAAASARQVSAGFQAWGEQINLAIRAAAAKARAGVIQSIAGAQGQAAGLDEAFDQIVAGGGSQQQQIAALKRKAAVQARIIEKAGPDAAGVVLQARRAARSKLAAINEQIRGIEESIAADRQAAEDAAARIAEDASRESDRRFLERQGDARARQERLVGLADESEGVRDDITRRQALRVLITQQIVRLRAAAVDEKTKQAALKALVAAKQATSDEINKLVRTQRALNNAERDAAAAEITENLALRTQIAEARGNESAVIRRIDAQITDAQKAIARAKKGTQEWLEATLAYEELRKKRRELLKDIEGDEDQGTTAFDLLTQAAERFTGGNIIGAAQPFAGPTEFTADLSQFLRRNATTSTAPSAKQSPFSGFTGAADRLVTAIERNTDALNGGEAGPTKRKGTRPPVSKAVGDTFRGWWQFADQARDQVEGAG